MFGKNISKHWSNYSVSPKKVYPITPKIKTFENNEETDKSVIQLQLIEQVTVDVDEAVVCSKENNEINENVSAIKQDTTNKNEVIVCFQETNEIKDNTGLVEQNKENENNTIDCQTKSGDNEDEKDDWVVFMSKFPLGSCYVSYAGYLYLGKDKYKNKCKIVFNCYEINKLRSILDYMPYKNEEFQSDYYELPLKTLHELGDSCLKNTNYLVALKYYADCAFLCVEHKQNSDKFCNKLYSIREYFTDFPDLKATIHGFMNAIRKYEKHDESQVYYLCVENSYHRLVKVIKMEDIFESFFDQNQIIPDSPPEIQDLNGLFFNWIYRNNLGMYFTNLVSPPILRDTFHMRAYKKFLWIFKAKLLIAIPNVSADDGHLLMKMAYLIQDTNGHMAAEFAKKALTSFKSCKNLKGQLSIHSFLGKCLHMNKFKDYIFEEPNEQSQFQLALKSILNRFKF